MNLFRRNAARAFLLLVLFLLLPRIVNACGCRPNMTTALDDFEAADLVVIAHLKSVTKGPNRFLSDISHSTWVVERVFKGEIKVGDELTVGQGDPVLHCSWDFLADWIGDQFLFYLYRPEKPSDPFYVSICNGSNSVEGAKADLLYLENIDKVRGRTRVSGVVELDDETYAGQQVRIVGKNKTYTATTDKDGVFELYDLPPGRYSIEPVLNPGWKVDEWFITREQTRAEWKRSNLNLPPLTKRWFTLRAKKHFEANISLVLANRIAGRVITPAGQPLHGVCVSLVSTEDASSHGCTDLTNADGSFEVESVDAGTYRLLINYQNIPSSRQPFPKLYYPGVASAEAAQVLTVKFGESIEGLKFVVPTMYETVKLEGVVRYLNGRPASKAEVTFHTPKTSDVESTITATTDKRGRFSLTVLKGLRGELYSTYSPDNREFINCSQFKRSLEQTGKHYFTTPRLQVQADENRTFELQLPGRPCR
jgi:5-hydroxyisourate hydrolase-like protein (transthyretin family)